MWNERACTAVRYYPDICAKYLRKTMTDTGYSVADRQMHYRCVVWLSQLLSNRLG